MHGIAKNRIAFVIAVQMLLWNFYCFQAYNYMLYLAAEKFPKVGIPSGYTMVISSRE